MTVELSVGPAALILCHGSTFIVSDMKGEIAAESEQGVFARDTRFLSYYSVSANGEPWRLLTSAATNHFSARVHLTNPPFTTEKGDVEAGTLELVISRAVGEGIHEDLDVTNYSGHPVELNLEIALRSDFADIFEVRTHRFVRRGHIETEWRKTSGELRVSYANGDFRRALIYRLLNCDTLPYYGNGRVSFVVALAAGKSWHTCAEYVLVSGDQARAPVYGCLHREESHLDRLQAEWLARATRITTANEDIYRFWRQSLEDMGALRLHEEDYASNLWLAAAGVPWYVTVFGRDSLIASMQNMIVDPTFALGALRWLGELQATEADDWRDAQPGKIPHEMRFGELAHLRKIPHIPYYGTADATALYLIVLHEAWRWLGEIELLREYREIAVGCLDWIDRHGDLDGDGFQEYETRSPVGYENQGWKDASDAVVYPDGSQVRQPKALCELQGYVFDAWMRMAEVFDVLEEPERSAQLRGKAELLRARFEDRFWCEEIGSYVFGLDREKRQIKTVASNAGHCLWSGIASPERAARVVARLLEPDMWSGWGIRTLSAGNPAYHPFSYQRGSVWPHDNGMIALGFKRYGFGSQAARVARDLSEAASSFERYRIPELYGGVPRSATSFPVQYPGANAPQAWAAGSIFHCIQAILGLGADAPNGRLRVAPELPHWLPDIVLHGLKVGGARVDLRFWREGERSRWEVLGQDGALQVREGSSRRGGGAFSG